MVMNGWRLRPAALIGAATLTLAATAAGAQTVINDVRPAPLALGMPGSSRALALGNAYPLGSAESDGIFYNPALLTSARGIAASVSRYGAGSMLFAVSGAAEWWNGGIGFGLQSLSYSAASTAAGAFSRGEAGLSETGETAASEQIVSAAYARTLFGFRVGIAGKLIDYRVDADREATAAADVGIVRSFGPATFGLTGRNIGRDPATDTFDTELPTDITLAAGSRTRATGPLDLMLAASVSWRRDETLAAGGGIEVSYWPIQGRTFTGRVGYRWIEDSDMRPLTLGAGFTGDRIAIDWAFEDVEKGDAVHRLTLRLR